MFASQLVRASKRCQTLIVRSKSHYPRRVRKDTIRRTLSRQEVDVPLRRTLSRQISVAVEHQVPVAIPSGVAAQTAFAQTGRVLLRAYLEALERNPLLVKTLAAIGIFACGDAMVQSLVEGKEEIDLYRLASRACAGAVFVFWVHPWWNFLEPRVQRVISYQANPWGNTLLKLFLDQTIGAVSVNIMYLTYISSVDGLDETETLSRIQEQLPQQLLAHWQVFPMFHLFNFRYVPLQHRVLTQNFISMGWAGFLSYRFRPGGEFDPLNKFQSS